jgi:hypothetical protein
MMRDSWLELVDTLLRPARPGHALCERERERCVAERKVLAEARTRRLSSCEARIERARADVFAADDGVVSARMTALEREWRLLARPDPDAGMMDLWARIAPASWVDRKRFRDSAPPERLDAAVALAADPDGVDAAEAAVDSLRVALAASGTSLGRRIRWRFFERDGECVTGLLGAPLRAAQAELSGRGICAVVLERGRSLEHDVHAATLARLPERGALARDVAHAAFVALVWRAASLELPDPTAPLRALWKTGYSLAAVSDSDVTLELPR